MIKSKDFATLKKPEQMTLVWLKVRDLGVEKHTAIEEIYRRAQEFGLDLLPPEAAPYLLLHHINQLLGREIGISTKKIIDESGSPRRFELERSGWGRALGGARTPNSAPAIRSCFASALRRINLQKTSKIKILETLALFCFRQIFWYSQRHKCGRWHGYGKFTNYFNC